jgi:hypothetical protein
VGRDRQHHLVLVDEATGNINGRFNSVFVEKVVINQDTDRCYLVGTGGMVQCLRPADTELPVFLRTITPPGSTSPETTESKKPTADQPTAPAGDAPAADPFGAGAEPAMPAADPFGAGEPMADPFGAAPAAPGAPAADPFGADPFGN